MNISRKLIYAVAVVALAAVVLILLELLITTDEERILARLDALVAAGEAGDTQAVMELIAPEYDHAGLTREGWNSIAEGYFTFYGPTEVKVLSKEVRVEGKLAVLDIAIFTRSSGTMGFSCRSRWVLSWRKQNDEWWIRQIEPRSFEGQPVDGLPEEIRRLEHK